MKFEDDRFRAHKGTRNIVSRESGGIQIMDPASSIRNAGDTRGHLAFDVAGEQQWEVFPCTAESLEDTKQAV